MVGYLAIFFFLGAAMASPRSEVEVVLKHKDYLGQCGDLGLFGINITACEAVIGEAEEMVELAESSEGQVESLIATVEDIVAQFNSCSSESIFKQIACYESVMSEAKEALADAEADINELLPKFEDEGKVLMADVKSCLGRSSVEVFETKMNLCKLKMLLKANFS